MQQRGKARLQNHEQAAGDEETVRDEGDGEVSVDAVQSSTGESAGCDNAVKIRPREQDVGDFLREIRARPPWPRLRARRRGPGHR